jgi:hypothetical protein
VLGHGQSQRTTQEGSGSGDLANAGTAQARLLVRAIAALRGVMEPRGRACCVSSRAGGGRMPAGAAREGRQSARVSVAGQEQGSRRVTARREKRGTEGGARINRWNRLRAAFGVENVVGLHLTSHFLHLHTHAHLHLHRHLGWRWARNRLGLVKEADDDGLRAIAIARGRGP